MTGGRIWSNIDWWLLVLVMALAAAGVVNLYSAASSFHTGGNAIYLKQLTWFSIGLGVMLAVVLIGHQRLASLAWLIYLLTVAGLVAVLFWGKVMGGSQRWLAVGPLMVQPSEFARLSIVIALSHYFARRDPHEPYNLRQLIPPLVMVAVPAALILKQPDLGTALLLVIIGASIILVNGVRLASLALMTAPALPLVIVGWSFLEDYQKKRIFSFLNPESDPLGSAYHIIQSKIAVGSGELFGKGFMAGTQSQLHFLPEQHTDFAFSVLAEEWGFVGAMVVLLLVLAIIIRALYQAWKAKDRLGMLLVAGATACLFWPTLINVGMLLGLFPVVGIPMPFISYGGSSMITAMAAIGLIQSVCIHRFIFARK